MHGENKVDCFTPEGVVLQQNWKVSGGETHYRDQEQTEVGRNLGRDPTLSSESSGTPTQEKESGKKEASISVIHRLQ